MMVRYMVLHQQETARPAYNKKVFSDAGITALPTTPEDFIADLQLIKDNTDAIPLHKTMPLNGQWEHGMLILAVLQQAMLTI